MRLYGRHSAICCNCHEEENHGKALHHLKILSVIRLTGRRRSGSGGGKFLTPSPKVCYFTTLRESSSVVELHLAKVAVAGSSPVSRSIFFVHVCTSLQFSLSGGIAKR